MATTYQLGAIPGDGVGPEVVAAARSVVDAIGARDGFSVKWLEIVAGGAGIDAYGQAIRDEDLAAVGGCDAILLGAVGGPRWDDPDAKVRPEQALFALRGGLELFANLRPVTVLPALVPASPLRPELLEGVDLLIVRELTSGLYFGRPSEQRDTPDGRVGIDTLLYTEHEIRRIVRLAFELARGRRGRLTSVDKANVLATSRLWRKVVEEVRGEFTDVEVGHQLVDSCAMLLVRRPAQFDVLVTENLFGDILSDEAAVLAGSLGLADAAASVERAVETAIADGYRTADLVPPDGDRSGLHVVGTREMAAAVVARLGSGGVSASESDDEAVAALVAANTLLGLP